MGQAATWAAPATHGLAAADAAAVTAVVGPFKTAFTAATVPATRTSATIATQEAVKEAMLAVVRRYYRMIQASAGVLDADKVNLGVSLVDSVAGRRDMRIFPRLNVLDVPFLASMFSHAGGT